MSESSSAYTEKTRRWALVAVLLFSFALTVVIAGPLWIPILLGVVMAISAQHPYRLLCEKLGKDGNTQHPRSAWAAGLVTLAVGLFLIVVGTAILLAITNELINVVAQLNRPAMRSLEGLIGARATHAIAHLGVDTTRVFSWLQEQIEAAAAFAATTAAVVVRATGEAVLGLVITLLTMYYVLLQGPSLAHRIELMAPLEPRHTRALLLEAREVSRSAFIGTIATAVVQGVLAGAGYAVLGVPQPVLWGAMTGLASFLPIIGTLLVWGPIAAYLALEGHTVRAVMMVVWGILVVSALADYVIRPRIVGGRSGQAHGHPLLTLIALLGGIEVFGLVGLIIAPIVMSVFVAAFRIYEREIATRSQQQSSIEAAAGAAAAGAAAEAAEVSARMAAGPVTTDERTPATVAAV